MMKKKLLALTLAFVMALSTGCGQNDSNKEKTKEVTQTESEVTAAVETTTYALEETTAKKQKKHKKETKIQETTVEETTTAQPTIVVETTTKKVETTTNKVSKKVVKKKEKVNKKDNKVSKNKAIAKKYVGKSLDSLTAKIGKYSSFDKADSCLEEGESDGFFYYDGFTVTATTKDGKWFVTGVQ